VGAREFAQRPHDLAIEALRAGERRALAAQIGEVLGQGDQPRPAVGGLRDGRARRGEIRGEVVRRGELYDRNPDPRGRGRVRAQRNSVGSIPVRRITS
jgi:hypothetical protein